MSVLIRLEAFNPDHLIHLAIAFLTGQMLDNPACIAVLLPNRPVRQIHVTLNGA
jgi:hypothetical protein